MSDLKQRTKEVESKTVELFGGDRGPAAIGTGHDSAGVDARSTRDGGGAAVSGGPVRRDAGGGSGDAGDSWTIKLIAAPALMLPANAKTIVVSDATTLPQLIASIKVLLPDGAEFTVLLNSEEMSEARMGLLRGATQLVLKGTAPVISQPKPVEVSLPKPTTQSEPVTVVRTLRAPAPVANSEPEHVDVPQHQPEPTTKTRAAAPSAARGPALSLVGRPEPVILPYSDDPTPPLRNIVTPVDSTGGQEKLLAEVTAATEEREREKENRIRQEEIAKHEQAKEAEQRAMDSLSERHIKVTCDNEDWNYLCDPDRVTVGDITAFIVDKGARFKNATFCFTVDTPQRPKACEALTVESQRKLLNDGAKVTAWICYIEVTVDNRRWKYYCDPSSVTIDNIMEFIVKQDKKFKNAKLDLEVSGNPLTVENQRALLKHRAMVLAPTAPAGGVDPRK